MKCTVNLSGRSAEFVYSMAKKLEVPKDLVIDKAIQLAMINTQEQPKPEYDYERRE